MSNSASNETRTDQNLGAKADPEKVELPIIGRYRQLATKWRALMAVLTAAASLLAMNQIFAWGFFVDYTMLDGRYLYLITGLMLIMVFITFPSTRTT